MSMGTSFFAPAQIFAVDRAADPRTLPFALLLIAATHPTGYLNLFLEEYGAGKEECANPGRQAWGPLFPEVSYDAFNQDDRVEIDYPKERRDLEEYD